MKFEADVDREKRESVSICVKDDIHVHTSHASREGMTSCSSDQVKSARVLLNDVLRKDFPGIVTLAEGLQWNCLSNRRFVVSGLTEAIKDLFVLSKLEYGFEISQAGEQL